jgi:suppressor of fused
VAEIVGLPGWEAIDSALRGLYPGVEPLHLGTQVLWADGGPDPLDAVQIYPRPDHWHIVGFGLSELGQKVTPFPDTSGWGFELTARACRDPGDDLDGETDAASDSG